MSFQSLSILCLLGFLTSCSFKVSYSSSSTTGMYSSTANKYPAQIASVSVMDGLFKQITLKGKVRTKFEFTDEPSSIEGLFIAKNKEDLEKMGEENIFQGFRIEDGNGIIDLTSSDIEVCTGVGSFLGYSYSSKTVNGFTEKSASVALLEPVEIKKDYCLAQITFKVNDSQTTNFFVNELKVLGEFNSIKELLKSLNYFNDSTKKKNITMGHINKSSKTINIEDIVSILNAFKSHNRLDVARELLRKIDKKLKLEEVVLLVDTMRSHEKLDLIKDISSRGYISTGVYDNAFVELINTTRSHERISAVEAITSNDIFSESLGQDSLIRALNLIRKHERIEFLNIILRKNIIEEQVSGAYILEILSMIRSNERVQALELVINEETKSNLTNEEIKRIIGEIRSHEQSQAHQILL